MSDQPTTDEVTVALASLKSKDRKQIDRMLAEKAFGIVFDKRRRNGRRDAIRYTLSELYIDRRSQKKFGAYWRLLRKALDVRERQTKSKARAA